VRLRSTTVAVALCGTLVGHAIAYSLPHEDSLLNTAAHGYLHLAYAAMIPLALVAAFVLIKRDGRNRPRLRELVACQVVFFLLQETVERGSLGGSPMSLLSEPVLWLGLAAQTAIALGAWLSIGVTIRLVRQLKRMARNEIPLWVASAPMGLTDRQSLSSGFLRSASARAPPFAAVTL
jgi:hypothetical protein